MKYYAEGSSRVVVCEYVIMLLMLYLHLKLLGLRSALKSTSDFAT